MLDYTESKLVHKDKEGDWSMKKKQDTEWSEPSQKYKWESAEFSRDTSSAKGSPSFT